MKALELIILFWGSLLTTLSYAETWPRIASPECQNWIQASTRAGDFVAKTGFRTDALLAMKNGQIVYEYYRAPFTADRPHALWSVSKTITATLIGIASQQGKIRLDDPISKFITTPQSHRQILVRDLLQMGSGINWREVYESDPRDSDVIALLYMQGYRDLTSYILSRPIISEGIGGKWNYSTGDSTLLAGVLKSVYAERPDRFPWTELADVIGMKHLVAEQDLNGTFAGGSGYFTTARDLAQLGLLMGSGGVWNGKRLLPEGWVEQSRAISAAYLKDATVITSTYEQGVYGMGWWLNLPAKGLPKPYPDAPDDLYMALGHYGQMLIIIPSQDLILVRFGIDGDYNPYLNSFFKGAIQCFR